MTAPVPPAGWEDGGRPDSLQPQAQRSPPPRVRGRRLGAALGLWVLLSLVLLGGTYAPLRILFPSYLSAHRAVIGAVLVVEAYTSLLSALLIAFGGWRGVRRELGFRFTSAAHVALALATWLGALFVGVLATALLSPLLGPPRSNATDLLGRSFDPLFVVLIVPTVCLYAPLCEELLFRGALFGWLRWRLPVPLAAVISAAAFAVAHLLPPLFPTLFVFGLAAAWICQRTGSTFNSFVMHASQNTAATLVAYAALTNRLPG
jgi:CAAX protease family protein